MGTWRGGPRLRASLARLLPGGPGEVALSGVGLSATSFCQLTSGSVRLPVTPVPVFCITGLHHSDTTVDAAPLLDGLQLTPHLRGLLPHQSTSLRETVPNADFTRVFVFHSVPNR